jgi:hypothetical protein
MRDRRQVEIDAAIQSVVDGYTVKRALDPPGEAP